LLTAFQLALSAHGIKIEKKRIIDKRKNEKNMPCSAPGARGHEAEAQGAGRGGSQTQKHTGMHVAMLGMLFLRPTCSDAAVLIA
jgi:hypothetical protein